MWTLIPALSLALAITITRVEILTVYLIPTISMVTVSPTTTSQSNVNQTFATEMVDSHNEKRSLHHSQPLTWNNTLFEYASTFVQQYDCSGVLDHSGGPYGENLALGYTPTGAIDAWYQEGKTYDYNAANTYNHFTQVIWNSTTQLGCAYKYCNQMWGDYIVCSYYPAGNIIGYNNQNIFP